MPSTHAADFLTLHTRPETFVLPNVWDAGSAKVIAQAGFPALGTTSAGIAFSAGLPDDGSIGREAMLERIAAIAAAVAIAAPALTNTTNTGDVAPTTVVAEVGETPAGPEAAAVAAPPAKAATPAAPAPAPRTNVQIVKQGFSQLPRELDGDQELVYAVLLRNPAKDRIALDVRTFVTFTARTGAVLKVKDEKLDALLPGQVGAVADSTEARGATRMRVQVQVGRWAPTQGLTGSLTASGIRTGRVAGELTTTAMLRSTLTGGITEAEAVAVWYDHAGRILGGHSEGVDVLPAGGSVPVRIDTGHSPRGIARTEVYASPKDLFELGD
jgi:hypothetical protein